jgi:hypothetical protein
MNIKKFNYFKMFKSSLFLILCILPIALQSDRLAKLESTDAGRTVLNTLMIQTKLHGVNANAIKTVLEATQKTNQSGLDDFNAQAKVEQAACKEDILYKKLMNPIIY